MSCSFFPYQVQQSLQRMRRHRTSTNLSRAVALEKRLVLMLTLSAVFFFVMWMPTIVTNVLILAHRYDYLSPTLVTAAAIIGTTSSSSTSSLSSTTHSSIVVFIIHCHHRHFRHHHHMFVTVIKRHRHYHRCFIVINITAINSSNISTICRCCCFASERSLPACPRAKKQQQQQKTFRAIKHSGVFSHCMWECLLHRGKS